MGVAGGLVGNGIASAIPISTAKTVDAIWVLIEILEAPHHSVDFELLEDDVLIPGALIVVQRHVVEDQVGPIFWSQFAMLAFARCLLAHCGQPLSARPCASSLKGTLGVKPVGIG